MAGEKMAADKMADKTAGSMGSSDGKLISALGYIILWPLIPLYVILTDKKNDKFMAFHAYQALLFGAAAVVVAIALTIVSTVLAFAGLGFVGCLIFPLWIVILLIALLCAYKAWMGEKYMLPVIGNMAQGYVK